VGTQVKKFVKKKTHLSVLALMQFSAIAAEVEVTPSISTSFLHVVDAASVEDNFEGHEVLLVKPKLLFNRAGSVWNLSVTADHTELSQLQSGYDDTSYTNYEVNNSFNWLQGRVSLTANASRNNQNIVQSFASVSDEIFGRSEFVDVDRFNTSLAVSNLTSRDWQSTLTLGYAETDFDETQLQDTLSTTTQIQEVKTKSAQLNLQYGQRPGVVQGGINASFSRNDRQNRGEQDSIYVDARLGIPLWRTIDLVATGTKSKSLIENSSLQNSNLESESYGAGVSWRFGVRSNIEITRNKDTKGEEEEFTGYRLVFYPNKRTSLTYEKSQRFYGESHALKLSHEGNRWGFAIDYGENLNSQTRINRTEISLGNFLCPEGVTNRNLCQSVEIVPDVIDPGQRVIEFTQPEFQLDEEVTLAKSGSASLTYRFRKTNVNIRYNKGETEFLEKQSFRDIESVSLRLNHKMTRRTSFNIAATQTKSKQDDNNLRREDYNVNINLERRLTRKATGILAVKKISNKIESTQQNREDTRVELTYTYEF